MVPPRAHGAQTSIQCRSARHPHQVPTARPPRSPHIRQLVRAGARAIPAPDPPAWPFPVPSRGFSCVRPLAGRFCKSDLQKRLLLFDCALVAFFPSHACGWAQGLERSSPLQPRPQPRVRMQNSGQPSHSPRSPFAPSALTLRLPCFACGLQLACFPETPSSSTVRLNIPSSTSPHT